MKRLALFLFTASFITGCMMYIPGPNGTQGTYIDVGTPEQVQENLSDFASVAGGVTKTAVESGAVKEYYETKRRYKNTPVTTSTYTSTSIPNRTYTTSTTYYSQGQSNSSSYQQSEQADLQKIRELTQKQQELDYKMAQSAKEHKQDYKQTQTQTKQKKEYSCWDAPEWCVKVVEAKWYGDKFVVKYHNGCKRRVYIRYCNKRKDGSWDCGADGIGAGQTSSWGTYNATGRYSYRFIGVENFADDWVCSSRADGWHDTPKD